MEIRHCKQCSEYTLIHKNGNCQECYRDSTQDENFGSTIVTTRIDPENYDIEYDIEPIHLFN